MNTLPQRSSQLDLLRTIAILLVFASHFNIYAVDEWFKAVGQFGWIGVDLFFTLSGFLITSQLLKTTASGKPISLKDFYIRRGLRIWPAYFFVLVLYIAIPDFAERGTLPPLWKFFTFTQNFGLDFQEQGAFSHAWSLCVEEQFYLLLPFILIYLPRFATLKKSFVILFSLIAAGIILRYSLWQHYVAPFFISTSHKGVWVSFFKQIYYPTYCRLDGLAIGVAIAALYRSLPELWKKLCSYSNWILSVGALLLVAALYLIQDKISLLSATIGFALVNLSFGCILLAALSPSGVFSRFRVPGVKMGATLAFSFYLTHKQMIHITMKWLTHSGVATTSALYPLGIFTSCLVSSVLLYFLVEKPFLTLRDKLIQEPTTSTHERISADLKPI